MNARACQAAYYPGPCSPEGPEWDVVHTSSSTPGKVLDRTVTCQRHGQAVVDRHHAAAGMALVKLVRVLDEAPLLPAPSSGRFVVIDLDDDVALHRIAEALYGSFPPEASDAVAALEEAGTLVEQVPDEEYVDLVVDGVPSGRSREVWVAPWEER